MAMTPKQKAYVKGLEKEVEKQKAVRDEMSVVNERWVNRCRAAEKALADLVAAAGPFTDSLQVNSDEYRELKAAVEVAKELCK